MELFARVISILYIGAEVTAEYPIGQALLYHVDKLLWILEKTAEWTVPPISDGESSSKRKELIRPLPWIFFLWLLVIMQLSREAISVFALVIGRPPIWPANVVTYIQGRRRFLRLLKYQGQRSMRRKSTQGNENIYHKIKALMSYTMCFRKAEAQYVNNNSAPSHYTDDKVLIKNEESPKLVISDEEILTDISTNNTEISVSPKTGSVEMLASERKGQVEPARNSKSQSASGVPPYKSGKPMKSMKTTTADKRSDDQHQDVKRSDNAVFIPFHVKTAKTTRFTSLYQK